MTLSRHAQVQEGQRSDKCSQSCHAWTCGLGTDTVVHAINGGNRSALLDWALQASGDQSLAKYKVPTTFEHAARQCAACA